MVVLFEDGRMSSNYVWEFRAWVGRSVFRLWIISFSMDDDYSERLRLPMYDSLEEDGMTANFHKVLRLFHVISQSGGDIMMVKSTLSLLYR